MKKNLLSLVILSLLVVNIILTAVMLFSVLSTNKKTAAVVTDIASILQLELNSSADGGAGAVSIADTEVHAIAEQTIALEREEGDTKDHFAVVSISLSLNMKHEDYAAYGADVVNKEDLIKSEIISVISSYTATEARLPEIQAKMCDEILARVQNLYGSTFIYKVGISNIIVQ